MSEAAVAKTAAKKDPNDAFFSALIPKAKDSITVPAFKDLTILLYGEPGTGKTNFATQNPDTFVIATEPGQDCLKVGARMVRRWARSIDPEQHQRDLKEGIFSFLDVLEGIRYLKNNGKMTYTCATIDIVDRLYDMCLTHVCAKKGIEYPPENDYGKTWKEVRLEWETALRQLMTMLRVTFITHCTTDTLEISDAGITKEIVRRVPTFKGNKAAQYLDGILNAMGFIFVGPKGDRYITFSSSEKLATKDRTDILKHLGVIKIPQHGCYAMVEKLYEEKAKELGCEISGQKKK